MKKCCLFLCLLLSLFFLSCTSQPITLNDLQPPPTSSQLRVFVQTLQGAYNWQTPYQTYTASTLDKVTKVLDETGLYEIVPGQEVDVVVGRPRRSLPWESNNYELSRRVASALYAEYTLLVERDVTAGQFYWRTTLINTRTGAVYKVSMYVPGGSRTSYQPVIRASYEQLFADAKDDMLATARLKRDVTIEEPSAPRIAGKAKEAPRVVSRNLNFSKIEKEQSGASGPRIPIAVYDLDTEEENKLISRILSESLRAELISLGGFQLVSRENLDKILEELSLQLSGIIDEDQAVKVGLGLAAKQIVIGLYGSIGTRSVIQVKRIDVETHETLGTGSLSCETGKEEELLDTMPDLASALSGKN